VLGLTWCVNVCWGQVVGGPAYNTRALGKGDVILEVDAMSIDIESLYDALVGSDVPGSTVTLRVKKAGSGDLKDVEVVRIESRELADKRRLFELFTDIENLIGTQQLGPTVGQQAVVSQELGHTLCLCVAC